MVRRYSCRNGRNCEEKFLRKKIEENRVKYKSQEMMEMEREEV